MEDACGGDRKSPVTGQLGSNGDINIFDISKETLVKQAYVVKHRAPVERCSRTGAEYLERLYILAVIALTLAYLERYAIKLKSVSDAVKLAAVMKI